MTRRLYWVRHGPTHQRAFTGWRDVPADLGDTGALARLSAFLPDAPVVSSDLSRAVATADMLQGNRDRLPHQPNLREFDFGAWDGLPHDAVSARDPQLSRAFWDDPGDIAPPGGESWNAVAERVGACIDALLHDVPGDLIAVAHFGTILCDMARRTRLAPKTALLHRIDTLSVTVLARDGTGPWRAERINHAP